MKRILLAYDGSHFAESALGDLPKMGLDADAQICILTVVSEPDDKSAVEKAESQVEHAAKVVRSLLPNAEVMPTVVAGVTADEILREATAQKSDLIIIGAHGKSLLERFFFGSTSTKVATEAPCSVRISRTTSEPGFQHLRLTLSLDGSAGSAIAIQKTLNRSWPKGSGFHVVTVVDSATSSDAIALHAMATQVAVDLKAAGHHAIPVLLEGDPAKELSKHSESWVPHCILMGSRGKEHGSTRKLGTLATEMVKAGHCEVEILR
jgi:nucleotide-binding universal stress UspA family protein